MIKLVDTSQKDIILSTFILDKVTRLRALLDPPPPRMVSRNLPVGTPWYNVQ